MYLHEAVAGSMKYQGVAVRLIGNGVLRVFLRRCDADVTVEEACAPDWEYSPNGGTTWIREVTKAVEAANETGEGVRETTGRVEFESVGGIVGPSVLATKLIARVDVLEASRGGFYTRIGALEKNVAALGSTVTRLESLLATKRLQIEDVRARLIELESTARILLAATTKSADTKVAALSGAAKAETASVAKQPRETFGFDEAVRRMKAGAACRRLSDSPSMEPFTGRGFPLLSKDDFEATDWYEVKKLYDGHPSVIRASGPAGAQGNC